MFHINMVSSNTIVFRVTMVDHMYLWAIGGGPWAETLWLSNDLQRFD